MALEDDLDFSGVIPTYHTELEGIPNLDGKDHMIKNYTFIDSERDAVGIFPRIMDMSNLFLSNVVIRGQRFPAQSLLKLK